MGPTFADLVRLGRILHRALGDNDWTPYIDISDNDVLIDGTFDLEPGEADLMRKYHA